MSDAAKLSYTINEAAAAIGVSRRTIYAMIEREELTAFKWCGRTLIRADVLREAMDKASGRRAA